MRDAAALLQASQGFAQKSHIAPPDEITLMRSRGQADAASMVATSDVDNAVDSAALLWCREQRRSGLA